MRSQRRSPMRDRAARSFLTTVVALHRLEHDQRVVVGALAHDQRQLGIVAAVERDLLALHVDEIGEAADPPARHRHALVDGDDRPCPDRSCGSSHPRSPAAPRAAPRAASASKLSVEIFGCIASAMKMSVSLVSDWPVMSMLVDGKAGRGELALQHARRGDRARRRSRRAPGRGRRRRTSATTATMPRRIRTRCSTQAWPTTTSARLVARRIGTGRACMCGSMIGTAPWRKLLGADLLQRGTTPGHEAATQQGQSGRSAASAHIPRFEVNFRLSLGIRCDGETVRPALPVEPRILHHPGAELLERVPGIGAPAPAPATSRSSPAGC